MNMTRADAQLEDATRLITQSKNTTRLAAQAGDSTCTSGLEDEKEVTRPVEREERKSRHAASKKAGGDKGLRIKRVRDPGLGSGIGIETAAEDGLVLENTVLRKIKKKRGKHPNNRVFQEISTTLSQEVSTDRGMYAIPLKEFVPMRPRKQDNHDVVDSQNSYSREVNKSDMGTY